MSVASDISNQKPHGLSNAGAPLRGYLHYLSIPLALLCCAGALWTGKPVWSAGLAVAQIAAAILNARVVDAFFSAPEHKTWVRWHIGLSALTGAVWGLGAVVWLAGPPATDVFFVPVLLSISTVELLVRCGFRRAMAAYTVFSLGPLIAMLLLQRSLPATLAALTVAGLAATLLHCCRIAIRMMQESKKLRLENDSLIAKLSAEKHDAQKARYAAEVSARAKTAFIANISHEIRTPLNALLGMSQLLDRADLDKPYRDYVKVMLEAGRGLRTLLDDVITLAREDNDNTIDDDSDPAFTARAVIQLLQPRAWEKSLRLSVNAASNLPRVAGDPRRVRQILLKLVENALKFTERGGVEVTVEPIRTQTGEERLRFSVIDTGHGIPLEVAATLFEPFTPGDTTYARRHQGAGLGLAVAKRIVEALGGNIGLESEPGQGATFWFELPTVGSRVVSTPQPRAITGNVAPPSGLFLLAYTADVAADMALAKALEPFGNRLVFASDASDAALRAGRGDFDIIVARAGAIEMLAAAPGVRAPLLALAFAGEKQPASGDPFLHWPAQPNELYAAMHAIVDVRDDESRANTGLTDTPAPIDASAFAALEKSLGLTTLVEILQSYIKTAETLCESFALASAEDNWDEAGRVAQDIAGAAGGLGLSALTTSARGFVQKARENRDAHELRNAAQMVVGEHVRARAALGNLYPDLAA